MTLHKNEITPADLNRKWLCHPQAYDDLDDVRQELTPGALVEGMRGVLRPHGTQRGCVRLRRCDYDIAARCSIFEMRKAFIRYIECRRWLARFQAQGGQLWVATISLLLAFLSGWQPCSQRSSDRSDSYSLNVYKAPRFCLRSFPVSSETSVLSRRFF
jgi:hypothetical protein